jgi:hypothetical protein
MAALSAYAVPEDAGYEEDQRSAAAWRDAVRRYALSRPAHAVALPQRWQRWGWLLAVALHLLVLVGMRSNLRKQQPAPESIVISVQLIDAPAPPPLPEPAPPALHPAPPMPVAAQASLAPLRRPPIARPPTPPPSHPKRHRNSTPITLMAASTYRATWPRSSTTPNRALISSR